LQLVRRLHGQDGEVVGEEVSATPKKIFQLLSQVNCAHDSCCQMYQVVPD